MSKKKIIDGNDLIEVSPVSGDKYIRIRESQKMPTIDIKEVKIIGKLQDTKEDIELSMNRKLFFEWVDKLKQLKKEE
jgi:hypothetical protein